MTSVLMRRPHEERQGTRPCDNDNGGRTGVTHLQAQAHPGRPAATRGWETGEDSTPLGASEGTSPAISEFSPVTPLSDLWPPGL